MAIQSLTDLKALINSTIQDNTTNDISGSDVQTALINAIDTLDSLEGFINVHKANGQTTITAYGSKALARAAVPDDCKKEGVVIAYKISTGWLIEQNLDATAGTWGDDASWQTIGPVSVSQNTNTKGQQLYIGGIKTGNIDDFFNVNSYNNKGDAYTDADAARAAVPSNLRALGMVITYLLADGWHTEQFIEDDVAFWNQASRWQNIVLSEIVLLNRNDKDGSIEITKGRIVIDRFFPISSEPIISTSITVSAISKRYYDSNFEFLSSTYSSDAKYVRIVLVINSTNTEIDDSVVKGQTLTINNVTYELGMPLLPLSQLYMEDILSSIVALNKNDNNGVVEDFKGRILVNRFFPISSEPIIACDIIPLVTIAKRYYDSNFDFLSSTYSSDAKYVRIVIVSNTQATELNDSIVDGKTLTVNGVVYALYTPSLPLHQPFMEKISSQPDYKGEELMQIFPKFTTIGDSLMAGYTNVEDVFVGSAAARGTKNNWVGYIEKRIGQSFTNLAMGSSTTHHWRYADGPAAGYIADINDANIPTDCYIIALGVNDKSVSMSVGTSADIATDYNNNADTYYGNYDYIVRKLLSFNPYAHLMCITNPASGAENYNAAIRYICGLYPSQVHCIDLALNYMPDFTSGIIEDNHYNGHYNPLAYNIISTIIQKAISDFIYNNNSLFKKVPYWPNWPN